MWLESMDKYLLNGIINVKIDHEIVQKMLPDRLKVIVHTHASPDNPCPALGCLIDNKSVFLH